MTDEELLKKSPYPRTWSLPPEPDESVKAVRTPKKIYVRKPGYDGDYWHAQDESGFAYAWGDLVAMCTTLTDATAELEERWTGKSDQ